MVWMSTILDVIASQRAARKARPMRGSAKQSSQLAGLLRTFSPLRKRFAFVAGYDDLF